MILATTAVLLGYLVIGLIKDRSARTNVSAHSLRYNVVSAFLAIAIGISINATWPQSQYIASVMLYIMALTSSADWLEVTKDEIVTKLFDVATVILSALFVWNNSYLYRWCIQHDPRGLVFLAISLEGVATICGGLSVLYEWKHSSSDTLVLSSSRLASWLKIVLLISIILASIVALIASGVRTNDQMDNPYKWPMALGIVCIIAGTLLPILLLVIEFDSQ